VAIKKDIVLARPMAIQGGHRSNGVPAADSIDQYGPRSVDEEQLGRVEDHFKIRELREGVVVAWKEIEAGLFDGDGFERAYDMFEDVVKQLFSRVAVIPCDTSRLSESIEDLLQLVKDEADRERAGQEEHRVYSHRDRRRRRAKLRGQMEQVKREFSRVEARIAWPALVPRVWNKMRGAGPLTGIKLPAEFRERAQLMAQATVGGISDKLAKYLGVSDEVQAALRFYGLNVWITMNDYKERRRKLLERWHPDKGGDLEEAKRVNAQGDIIERWLGHQ
jgi:hypothetical protein